MNLQRLLVTVLLTAVLIAHVNILSYVGTNGLLHPMAYVTLRIDPQNSTCTVKMEILNLDLDYIDMYLKLGMWGLLGAIYRLYVLSDAEKLSDFTYRVPVKNGRAILAYQVWLPLKENILSTTLKTNKRNGIDPSYAVLGDGIVFATPVDYNIAKLIPVILTIEVSDPSWIVLTPYKKLGENTYTVKNFVELSRLGIVAGKPRYYKVEVYPHYNVTYTLFYPPSFAKETNNRQVNQDPFVFYKYLSRKDDAEAYIDTIKFYIDYYSTLFSYPPPSQTNIVWYYMAVNWRGFWHIDFASREHHITHHIIHFWFPSVISTGLDEGIAMYYDVWGVYARTGKKYYLAYDYIRYILFERGLRQRLLSGNAVNDKYYDLITPYGLHPVIVAYLDYLIQEKTSYTHSFADVLRYIIHRYEYSDRIFTINDYPELVKEALGIDIEKDFKEALNNYNFTRMESFLYKHYGVHLSEFLDYIRDDQGAPPILYYIYLELESKRGNPDPTTYRQVEFYDPDWNEDFKSLISEFINEYPLTEQKLINILNKYTNGTSRDFFEYYTSKFPIPPRIEDLNAWLNGTYATTVRKLVYMEKILERYGGYMDMATYKELKDIVRDADHLLDNGQVIEALNLLENGTKYLSNVLHQDSDNDSLPDIYELMYGLNPYSSSTYPHADDAKLYFVAVDGYGYEWGHVNASIVFGEGVVKELRAFVLGNYIYGVAFFSKPIHDLNARIGLEVRTLDQTKGYGVDVTTATLPWGSSMPPLTYIYPYTAVVDNILEFRIPLDTFELGFDRLPDKLELVLYVDNMPLGTWLGREFLGIARLTIDLNSKPVIFDAMAPSTGFVGEPIVLYGTAFPVNGTVTIEVLRENNIVLRTRVSPSDSGLWFYSFTPSEAGNYVLHVSYMGYSRVFTVSIEPRTKTVTLTQTMIQTTTKTQTVTETKPVTIIEVKTRTETFTQLTTVTTTAIQRDTTTKTVTTTATIITPTTETTTLPTTYTVTSTYIYTTTERSASTAYSYTPWITAGGVLAVIAVGILIALLKRK